MTEVHLQALAFADRIEAELKSLGAWSETPPTPEAFESRAAFFADTMSFCQWLQFVLLDRIRTIAADEGEFPSRSQVGVYAVRELDGLNEASNLVSLLSWLDALIEGRTT